MYKILVLVSQKIRGKIHYENNSCNEIQETYEYLFGESIENSLG